MQNLGSLVLFCFYFWGSCSSAFVRSLARAALPQDHLTSEPDSLGDIAHKGDLPFLFKVISINKALSIQVSRPETRSPT